MVLAGLVRYARHPQALGLDIRSHTHTHTHTHTRPRQEGHELAAEARGRQSEPSMKGVLQMRGTAQDGQRDTARGTRTAARRHLKTKNESRQAKFVATTQAGVLTAPLRLHWRGAAP